MEHPRCYQEHRPKEGLGDQRQSRALSRYIFKPGTVCIRPETEFIIFREGPKGKTPTRCVKPCSNRFEASGF